VSKYGIVPPRFQALATGVNHITIEYREGDPDTVGQLAKQMREATLHYCDDTSETATIEVPQDGYFDYVAAVQETRKSGNPFPELV
jgi:hypothetical protein